MNAAYEEHTDCPAEKPAGRYREIDGSNIHESAARKSANEDREGFRYRFGWTRDRGM